MAGQQETSAEGAGPGNRAIATILLEGLAVAGRSAARERAERALGLGEKGLASAPLWLAEDAIAAMFSAAEVDDALARSIGNRLVSPDATGMRLYGLGLATPEKAYRRLQALLPRAEPKGHWSIGPIEDRRASLRFDKNAKIESVQVPGKRTERALCAMRKGLLEAIPGLYGLLPADVEETACYAEGAPACFYEVRWQATPQANTIAGLCVGAGVAAGLGAAAYMLGAGTVFSLGPFGAILIGGISAVLLGPAVGRVLDLRAQLEAVAGARRGHLALFDQVDDALAEKLDALARADAGGVAEPTLSPLPRVHSEVDPAEVAASLSSPEGRAAAQRIHALSGDLDCWFEEGAVQATEVDPRGILREIRKEAARLGQLGGSGEPAFQAEIDLDVLVRRAMASLRPTLPPGTRLEIDIESDLRLIECDPVQIEQVLIQLVRNAVEASIDLEEAPQVVMALRNEDQGVEIRVEDRGVGIDSTEVDEVFDPFFDAGPAGAAGGLGLTVCLRIVEGHGGALRISAGENVGTSVTVFLPEVASSAATESNRR